MWNGSRFAAMLECRILHSSLTIAKATIQNSKLKIQNSLTMLAKNNIFNIRATKSGAKWLGQEGATKGFVDFSNPDLCIRAWCKLMATYRFRYGVKTISGIVKRFAPPNENNTDSYIRFCCQRLAMQPTTKLTTVMDYARLASAMAKMETGNDLAPNKVIEVIRDYKISMIKYDN